MPFDLAGKRIYIAGHRGMVGSALVRRLASEGCETITADRGTVDLIRQDQVESFLKEQRPDVVMIAAARVGGIHANDSRPAEFLYDNMMIEANLIHAAHQLGVEKLVFFGSTCIYPKFAAQPISEDSLLTGALEPTNQWYAVAKIAGIKLCQAYRRQYGCDYIAVQPTNLYGPGDNYDLTSSHVLPALLRKAHEAKARSDQAISVWGDGSALREFMHVDDLADAAVHLLKHYSGEGIVNIGSGAEVTIADLANIIMQIVGFKGRLEFDASKPNGTPRKLVDTARLKRLGWDGARNLEQGIADTYSSFLRETEVQA